MEANPVLVEENGRVEETSGSEALCQARAIDPGLCRSCRNVKMIRSDRGSVFYRCMLSDRNPQFPKYLRLPVFNCSGWTRIEPE